MMRINRDQASKRPQKEQEPEGLHFLFPQYSGDMSRISVVALFGIDWSLHKELPDSSELVAKYLIFWKKFHVWKLAELTKLYICV